MATFADDSATWPKAVAKITDDLDELLAFYDFPAEHLKHRAAGCAELRPPRGSPDHPPLSRARSQLNRHATYAIAQ